MPRTRAKAPIIGRIGNWVGPRAQTVFEGDAVCVHPRQPVLFEGSEVGRGSGTVDEYPASGLEATRCVDAVQKGPVQDGDMVRRTDVGSEKDLLFIHPDIGFDWGPRRSTPKKGKLWTW